MAKDSDSGPSNKKIMFVATKDRAQVLDHCEKRNPSFKALHSYQVVSTMDNVVSKAQCGPSGLNGSI